MQNPFVVPIRLKKDFVKFACDLFIHTIPQLEDGARSEKMLHAQKM